MNNSLWLDTINKEKILSYKRLKGGVSSEVYKIKTTNNLYCLKRCLKKLLVKKKWIVDINRVKYEYLWLKHCKNILNNNIPKIFYYDEENKSIVMEYFNSRNFKTLKELYFDKNINQSTLKSISKHLYKIHTNSKSNKIKIEFEGNKKNFYDLRLDAYFNEVGRVYPKYKKYIENINKNYAKNSTTLVHGDFSPKNILIGNRKIIYIDAECSNYGDPVFDLVFFSNHLLIKSIVLNEKKEDFLKGYKTFYNEYLSRINRKSLNEFYNRIIKMTPIMLLARIDGKSPVEYIKSKKIKDVIRKKSFKLLNSNINTLEEIIEIIYE